MNLHPYLTPELLALIRTAKPEDIAHRLEYCYNDGRDDVEVARLGFRVEAKRSGGRRIGLNLPISYDGFAFSSGYQGMKRRVDLKVTNWRELFITRFNEVLHDCEARKQVSRRDANAVKRKYYVLLISKGEVSPLMETRRHLWLFDNHKSAKRQAADYFIPGERDYVVVRLDANL